MTIVRVKYILLFVILVLLISGCTQKDDPQRIKRLDGLSIEQTLDENRQRLLAIPGVTGIEIGECKGSPCIQVKVEKKTAILENQVPRMLETWNVEIVEVAK